jgi:hypothetical protein
MSASDALWPAMIDAGSPGTSCMIEAEIRLTRKSTGTAASSRRSTNSAIV